MNPQIVQVNYRFQGTRAQYEKVILPFSEPIAAIPSMRWKIWLMNEGENEGNGIMLFDDEAAAHVST